MNRKKVIFVGGTAFSGSTFFHMTLANDPHGFACGEAHNFFRPTRPGHFSMKCSCGDPNCELWSTAKANGEKRIYETIFEMKPEVDFIVDSSKSPFWIDQQSRYLVSQGIDVRHVMIWKTPLEFAHSSRKRVHHQLDWEKAWVNFHRAYYSKIDDWFAVSYRDYTSDVDVLAKICDRLEIPYFEDKVSYWEKDYHVIGGNPTARIHLYSESSDTFADVVDTTASDIGDEVKNVHKSIYYSGVDDEELASAVDARIAANPYLPLITDLLQTYDVANPPVASNASFLNKYEPLKMSVPMLGLMGMKQRVDQRYREFRYG